jgi:hypothetical protein
MLIAEIHGKRCPDIEGLEDLFTSAVFGHLRSIPPNIFWSALFRRAWNLEDPACSLERKLQSLGVDLNAYDSLEIDFWSYFEIYGEPDLILYFTGLHCEPILLLIEVKLYSSKSGTGDNDQLAKYLRLIGDAQSTAKWKAAKHFRFVIYLTRNFASDEMSESLQSYSVNGGDARPVLFGLEWLDIFETANALGLAASDIQSSRLLSEVARFLKVRGFDGFRGFKPIPALDGVSGCFYQTQYFHQDALGAELIAGGRFYGN